MKNEVMMTNNEVECIEKYLNNSDLFFEWGSGGSTTYYCNFVKEYYSVEHHKHWYETVQSRIKSRNINNVFHSHVSPTNIKFDDELDKAAPNHLKLWDGVVIKNGICYHGCRGIPTLDWHCYIDYINHISTIGKQFDKILIDGRARVHCGFKALNYLKNDGILFFHDWFRTRYHGILEYYDEIEVCETLAVLRKK